MKYRFRTSNYVFTVTKGPAGEDFFKQLRSLKPVGTKLSRLGRQRDRSKVPSKVKYGHVALQYCDRWDLYIKVPCKLGSWQIYEREQVLAAQKLIQNAARLIEVYSNTIEYSNEAHKPVFEPIFNPQSIPTQIKTVNMINTKTTSTWKVNLTAEIVIFGETYADLEKQLKAVGCFSKPPVITQYERLDLYRDLPLVRFGYPEHGNTYNETKLRSIRVTKMDATMVEGFEGNTWKKFLRDKIVGRVEIIEVPSKKD